MDRILAFGCHPDDIEFMAAGTLALLAQRGYEIHCATITGGELGHPTLSPQEIREVRTGEAAASAKVLNGHYHYAGGYDLEVELMTGPGGEFLAFMRRLRTEFAADIAAFRSVIVLRELKYGQYPA